MSPESVLVELFSVKWENEWNIVPMVCTAPKKKAEAAADKVVVSPDTKKAKLSAAASPPANASNLKSASGVGGKGKASAAGKAASGGGKSASATPQKVRLLTHDVGFLVPSAALASNKGIRMMIMFWRFREQVESAGRDFPQQRGDRVTRTLFVVLGMGLIEPGRCPRYFCQRHMSKLMPFD